MFTFFSQSKPFLSSIVDKYFVVISSKIGTYVKSNVKFAMSAKCKSGGVSLFPYISPTCVYAKTINNSVIAYSWIGDDDTNSTMPDHKLKSGT